MFAFAAFDRKERVLTLARDRLGIKPVYWGRVDGRVVFASELKAFAALPKFAPAIESMHGCGGPLKDWAANLLDPNAMSRAGLLDPWPIQEKWAEHLSGRRNWHSFLWNVPTFEATRACLRSIEKLRAI